MAELADARDLKSREIYFSYRFDPGFRHHISRSGAVWQLVGLITRRSWGSNPTSATKKENTPLWCVFSFHATRVAWDLSLTICALWARPFGIRANNLQPKEKRLSIVFSTVDTAEQGVREASRSSDNERLCERWGRSWHGFAVLQIPLLNTKKICAILKGYITERGKKIEQD